MARLSRNPYFWAFFIGIACITAMRPLLRRVPAPPPALFRLPEFTLADAAGRRFGSSDLAGSVYVLDFFCTAGAPDCPEAGDAMAALEARYREAGVEGVRLVSISVDPARDTPERLREYAALHGVDARRWTLLTGDARLVRERIRDGLGGASGGRLVLVDRDGAVRGGYGIDALGLDEVFHRSRHVLDERR